MDYPPEENAIGESEHTRLNKLRFLKALGEHRGIVSRAAEAVHIARKTHYEWLNEDPNYAENVRLVDDELCDFIEGAFIDKIKESSEACILKGISSKCRKRGYGDAQKIELDGELKSELSVPAEVMDMALDKIYDKRQADAEAAAKAKTEAEQKRKQEADDADNS